MKYVLIFFLLIETICFAQTNRTVEANKFNMVETVANGKNTISLIPPNLSSSYTLTWPVDDGTSNQVLTTDGSGVLSWSSVAASSIAIGNTVTSGTPGSVLFVGSGPVLSQTAVGSSGQILTSAGTGTPVWVTLLPFANGGCNKALSAVAGGVFWSDSDSCEITAAGTSGQFLKSNGTSAPSFGWGAQVAAFLTFSATGTISTSSTSYTFATNSSWTGPTVVYNNTGICTMQTTDANGPRITCNSAIPGTYTIIWNTAWIRNNTNDVFAYVACNDGSTQYDLGNSRSTSSTFIFPLASPACSFTYGGTANRTWELDIKSENGAATTDLAFNGNGPVIVLYSPIP